MPLSDLQGQLVWKNGPHGCDGSGKLTELHYSAAGIRPQMTKQRRSKECEKSR